MSWLAAPMEIQRTTHGWAGSIENFLQTPPSLIESELERHLAALFGQGGASNLQRGAWIEEIDILRNVFRNLSVSRPDSLEWSIVLEYELPLEGGRRPDVILLAPSKIIVLEFKQDPKLSRAAFDQVAAYARDLSEYHSKSHTIDVEALVVPTKSNNLLATKENVIVVSPDLLAAQLDGLPTNKSIDLTEWLEGDYAPLPTLIAAAKMIFNHERLPAIKRAESLGVREAVNSLKKIAKQSKNLGQRSLAFVSGVPGAGKTLVGLQFVYEGTDEDDSAIFLSGNGPLVEVLRDALKSKAFVRDLHSFIKTYGLTVKVPAQNIIVFDEAQRAWDSTHMNAKNSIDVSEPQLLIAIGEKLPHWATLVGLIGHGQEINSGEEAGIPGWSDALNSSSATSKWKVFAPSRFIADFAKHDVTEVPELDLNKSLRSRQAEDLHQWVECLLSGDLSGASRIATGMLSQNYPILLTRDLEEARNYINEFFKDQPGKRCGILASSKDQILPNYGLLNGFQDTKRVKYAKWYNSEVGEIGAGSNLVDVITEFGCQGLELDMALVAWGNDFLWNGQEWVMRKLRPKFHQDDPHQLRKNSYRVLLTRSRDGVVLFIPPEEKFHATEHALLAAGARLLLAPVPVDSI